MQFKLAPDLLERFPDFCVAFVVATNLRNEGADESIAADLHTECTIARASLAGKDVADLPAVAAWRDAFERAGIDPDEYPSSIESLLRARQPGRGDRRRSARRSTWRTSPASATACRSARTTSTGCAATSSSGSAREGDVFTPLGQRECERVPAGEVVYADDARGPDPPLGLAARRARQGDAGQPQRSSSRSTASSGTTDDAGSRGGRRARRACSRAGSARRSRPASSTSTRPAVDLPTFERPARRPDRAAADPPRRRGPPEPGGDGGGAALGQEDHDLPRRRRDQPGHPHRPLGPDPEAARVPGPRPQGHPADRRLHRPDRRPDRQVGGARSQLTPRAGPGERADLRRAGLEDPRLQRRRTTRSRCASTASGGTRRPAAT